MIINSEIAGLSEADLHYALCVANLEAAQRLSKDMIIGDFSASFSHATVIISLVHHGVELFLKYAISKSGKKTPTHHYIRGLLKEYKAAYPDESFRLYLPFITQYLGYSEDTINELIKKEENFKNQTDQMGRYHCDQFGKQWEGIHAFTPEYFLAQVESLTSRFTILRNQIDNT